MYIARQAPGFLVMFFSLRPLRLCGEMIATYSELDIEQ
jgi:hypothetical protein